MGDSAASWPAPVTGAVASELPTRTIREPGAERRTASGGGRMAGSGTKTESASSPRPQFLSSLIERSTQSQLARTFENRAWQRVRLIVDIVVLYLACGAAVLGDHAVRSQPASDWLGLTFPLVVLAMMHARRSPDTRLNGSLLEIATHVLGVVSLATMLMIAVASIFGEHPLQLSVRLWLFAVVYLGLSRSVLLWVRRAAMSEGAYAIPTLVLGAGTVGTRLVNRLAEDPSYGLRPVGFLDSNPLPAPTLEGRTTVPVLGGLDDLADAVALTDARRVILAFSSEPDHVLVAKVRECQQLGIDVSLVPRLYESINERATLDHVGGVPLLTLQAVDPRGWQFALKHAIDRTSALLGLIVLSPLMLVIAVAVKASSRGPVLFRQRRVGRDGTEFDLLKFRTMSGPVTVPHEFRPIDGMAPGGVEGLDRRTRVGRILRNLSIDELPQLFNVLRGDMSIVGPRPERSEFVERFVKDVAHYQDRHRVKSGITGWAQVHGLRGQTSIADRVEWDNYYILNWSLGLDLKIIAMTVVEVLRLRDSQATARRDRP
jgi:exopolysaccharide biosynthesis polyprenyl glycosylphosphotransferase